MALEIERKFLVKNDNWQRQVISESRMKQGYLTNQQNVSVRVRIARDKAYLNIKSATLGIRRVEFEYEIPVDEAEQMLEQLAERPYIAKTRYLVKSGDHIWELDVFDGPNLGLVVAEVELSSEEEAISIPDWAGEEVSEDPKYYNVNLVKRPFNTW